MAGETPLPGDGRYIGYPLHGKKHSSLLLKEEFKKILAEDPDYQRLVQYELNIADKVMAAHKANRDIKAKIARLWRSVVSNDRKVWGMVRQKGGHAHGRKMCALRLYRHHLAAKLKQEGNWKHQYDKVEDDDGAEKMVTNYQRDWEPEEELEEIDGET